MWRAPVGLGCRGETNVWRARAGCPGSVEKGSQFCRDVDSDILSRRDNSSPGPEGLSSGSAGNVMRGQWVLLMHPRW